MMQRLVSSLFVLLILPAILLALFPDAAAAQADAQKAFQDARSAFDEGHFATAAKFAEKASQTDPKNPEVFLLLGKAHYQLGHLDKALDAWKKTLRLAPEEPYAKRMLKALQAETTEVDMRIKAIEMIGAERLYKPALLETSRLLYQKTITKPQRARVMMLQAKMLIRSGKYDEAYEVLQKVKVLYAKHVDAVELTLLTGQAKLHLDPKSTSEGMKILKKVIADHPKHPAAALAEYELITFRLEQGVDADGTAALATWLATHKDHELATPGFVKLLDAYIELAGQEAKPARDNSLGKTDQMILAVATELYKRTVNAKETMSLTWRLTKYIDNRFMNNEAYAAASKTTAKLLDAPLNRADRLLVLKYSLKPKTEIAMEWLKEQSRTGQLAANAGRRELPKVLADLLAAYETIRKEYPSEPHWYKQAELAKQVKRFADSVHWPHVVTRPRTPEIWALEIAWPIVKADANPRAVRPAVTLILEVGNAIPRTNAATHKLAVSYSSRLMAILPADHPMWAEVANHYYSQLNSYANHLFQENLKAGRPEANAKFSAPQEAMLDTLKTHVVEHVDYASTALQQLAEFCKPLAEHGHWKLVDKAYGQIAVILPKNQQRQAELALACLWMEKVTKEHQRLMAAGLKVPRKLAPVHVKILKRCYTLQDEFADDSLELQMVRSVYDRIVNHYKIIEYYDIAKEAIQIKTDASVEAADEYAAFSLIRLEEDLARRDLHRLMKQYDASEKVGLEKTFEKVITDWTKFIADRPTSPLVHRAVDHIFAVGQLFERKKVYGGAATVYGDFAKAAAKINVLSQAKPGDESVVQRAAFAAASALEAKGREALNKLNAERKSDDPAPTTLSKEYRAAIDAYKNFVKTYPDSPKVAAAIQRIMTIAQGYANIDAWDVADAVYADLSASKIEIRHPERLKFAQGLCQLGHAMPDHARQILQVLTGQGLRSSSESSNAKLLAANIDGMRFFFDDRTKKGDYGGGGFGGMGGGRMGMSGAYKDATRKMRMSGEYTELADSKYEKLPCDKRIPMGGKPVPCREAPVLGNPVATPAYGGYDMSGQMATSPGSGPVDESLARRDTQLLASIQRAESQRAAQVAQMRGRETWTYRGESSSSDNTCNSNYVCNNNNQPIQLSTHAQQYGVCVYEVFSPAELARQEKAIDAAYKIFQAIRKEYPHTDTAKQARGEILVMVSHWRTKGQWDRSAVLAMRFLKDNPTDSDLPKLRLEAARDHLAWATKPITRTTKKQELLSEVCKRFDTAREELAKIVTEFPKQQTYQQKAQWDIASSFLTQARVVNSFSATLARGQYVRAAKELAKVAEKYSDHPRLGEIPQMLWTISNELGHRGYYEEAILVWNELTMYNPMDHRAKQAALKIAQTYHHQLKRPLRAAEAYQEINFARGGSDQSLQNAIFQIGSDLKNQKRWVESLHVLESFVDSFPKHSQAGRALTMVGQIHQTNEAWEDAIEAYRQVIAEFPNGQWSQEAKWAIAECKINLSKWHEAKEDYLSYVETYHDSKVNEARRRIELLKDLERYQGLVDEKGQRKAFDAQYQIAEIVKDRLQNKVKAIIEYRKVTANWPKSHLADDALYSIGTTYLSLGETTKAREALLEVGKKYPASPLADDALYMVGKSYEEEATKLASVTRESTIEKAKEVAQRRAYTLSQSSKRMLFNANEKQIYDLKRSGKGKAAEAAEASNAAKYGQFSSANAVLYAQKAEQEVESLSAAQMADRQDKVNAALRKAVESFTSASRIAGADKADEALLQMATIYDTRLKDSKAAMETWLEIVRQFSGTTVAEDASWRIAEYYQRESKYAEAIEAYQAFLRNYRRSPKAGAAQFAVAENNEKLNQWVQAMDAYTNYLTNFPNGPLASKAKEQINWIKTYRL